MELVPYLNVVAVLIFFNLFGYSSIVPDLMFSRIERLLEKMLQASEISVEDCCVGGAVLERRANQVGSPWHVPGPKIVCRVLLWQEIAYHGENVLLHNVQVKPTWPFMSNSNSRTYGARFSFLRNQVGHGKCSDVGSFCWRCHLGKCS